MENSTRRTGLQENVTKSGFDPLSLRCLRDGQVEMSYRWLEFGVRRQVLAGVSGIIEMVKNAQRVGCPMGKYRGRGIFARRAALERKTEALRPRKEGLLEAGCLDPT